jgi:hypothetical protein
LDKILVIITERNKGKIILPIIHFPVETRARRRVPLISQDQGHLTALGTVSCVFGSIDRELIRITEIDHPTQIQIHKWHDCFERTGVEAKIEIIVGPGIGLV